jgi:hypothetical protein
VGLLEEHERVVVAGLARWRLGTNIGGQSLIHRRQGRECWLTRCAARRQVAGHGMQHDVGGNSRIVIRIHHQKEIRRRRRQMRGDLDLGRRLGVYINESINQLPSSFDSSQVSGGCGRNGGGDAPAVGISWAGWVTGMPSRTGTSSSFALKYDESSGGMREARARELHCSRQAAARAEENFIGDRLRQDGF